MIKVTREYLSRMLYYLERSSTFRLAEHELNKVQNLFIEGISIINEYDRKEEEKQIGSKFKQQNLFDENK